MSAPRKLAKSIIAPDDDFLDAALRTSREDFPGRVSFPAVISHGRLHNGSAGTPGPPNHRLTFVPPVGDVGFNFIADGFASGDIVDVIIIKRGNITELAREISEAELGLVTVEDRPIHDRLRGDGPKEPVREAKVATHRQLAQKEPSATQKRGGKDIAAKHEPGSP